MHQSISIGVHVACPLHICDMIHSCVWRSGNCTHMHVCAQTYACTHTNALRSSIYIHVRVHLSSGTCTRSWQLFSYWFNFPADTKVPCLMCLCTFIFQIISVSPWKDSNSPVPSTRSSGSLDGSRRFLPPPKGGPLEFLGVPTHIQICTSTWTHTRITHADRCMIHARMLHLRS